MTGPPLPPPDQRASLFSSHAHMVVTCDTPADLDSMFAAARDTYRSLIDQRAALEHQTFEDEHLLHDLEGRLNSPPQQLTSSERRGLREAVALYRAIVEDSRHELAALEEALPRLESRLAAFANIIRARAFEQSRLRALTVSPTGLNSGGTPARYFRLLVWNLENFTRDRRPRGSAPIDSLRNQVRIALVAHLAQALGVDAIVVMETGTDVGTAMTGLARRLQAEAEAAGVPRHCEPLVSPATHEVPNVAMDHFDHVLTRCTGDVVLALRVLLDSFDITPHESVIGATIQPLQLAQACRALAQASSAVAELEWFPFGEDGTWPEFSCYQLANGCCSPGPAWIYHLFGILTESSDGEIAGWKWEVSKLTDWLRQLPQSIAEQDTQRLCAMIGDCRWLTTRLRLEASEARAVGAVQMLELALLFLLKAHGRISVDRQDNDVWIPDGPADFSLPLLAFYCGGARRINLVSRDRDIGPIDSASDRELVFTALRRIGVVQYNLETYGIVYRPWTRRLLDDFFHHRCLQSGFDADGIYGILANDEQGNALRVQSPGHPLSGRSALQIAFPVGYNRWIPIALHHNRFTGSRAISEMSTFAFQDVRYSQDDNVLRARALSLVEIARAAGQQPSPPLVVGDFNIPSSMLEAEPEPTSNQARVVNAYRRRQIMRTELRDGVAMHGFQRRTSGDQHLRTSLAAHTTIASGGPVYSEPYDAVYQPFDFMDGGAIVRSGVIQSIAVLVPASAFNLRVDARLPPEDEVEDVAVGAESLDDSADDEVPTMDVDPSPNMGHVAPLASATVAAAFAFELRRIHRSIHRRAAGPIEASRDWIRRHLIQLTETGASPEQIGRVLELSNTDALMAEADARCQQFFQAVRADPSAVLVVNPDPLDAWIARAAAVAQGAARPPNQVAGLAAALTTVRDQLRGLEQNPDRRAWAAYRAIVSDHLPVIVEIDLQPFSD